MGLVGLKVPAEESGSALCLGLVVKLCAVPRGFVSCSLPGNHPGTKTKQGDCGISRLRLKRWLWSWQAESTQPHKEIKLGGVHCAMAQLQIGSPGPSQERILLNAPLVLFGDPASFPFVPIRALRNKQSLPLHRPAVASQGSGS